MRQDMNSRCGVDIHVPMAITQIYSARSGLLARKRLVVPQGDSFCCENRYI